MIFVLCGHRGVGKTSLMRRLSVYMQGRDVLFYDLDAEIEIRTKRTIQDLFTSKSQESGEEYFRLVERQVFGQICREVGARFAYISVGGGFPVSNFEIDVLRTASHEISKDISFIWLQRSTDRDGRIFLDRPSLEPDVPPLEEFKIRLAKRQPLFESSCQRDYVIPEGMGEDSAVATSLEKDVFLNQINNCGGCLTLLPSAFRSVDFGQKFLLERQTWGLDLFELRSDLLSLSQIKKAMEIIPSKNIIYSVRNHEGLSQVHKYNLWDWPLELGQSPSGYPSVISLHERRELEINHLKVESKVESVEQASDRLETSGKKAQYLKLAIEIFDFHELEVADKWRKQNPERNQFLPRSQNGRWSWYRCHQKGQMKINFIREGIGSAMDQPTLFEWLSAFPQSYRFAAVLGDPIHHSYTPIEHLDFFHQRGLAVHRIQISANEMANGGFEFLKSMGLSYAAVTSPLKISAFQLSQSRSPMANELKAANTLFVAPNEVCCHNTDQMGLEELLEEYKDCRNIAVWGGGGTLTAILKTLPQSVSYSVRTGLARNENQSRSATQTKDQMEPFKPEILVWAGGKDSKMPPDHWRPKIVVDLSYTDNSLARQYCLLKKCIYQSGKKMFLAQARGQRKFWQEQER